MFGIQLDAASGIKIHRTENKNTERDVTQEISLRTLKFWIQHIEMNNISLFVHF